MSLTVPLMNWFAQLSRRSDWEKVSRQVAGIADNPSEPQINEVCLQEILMAVPGVFAPDWKYHQQVLTNKQKDVWHRVNGLDQQVSLSDVERVIERARSYVPQA